MKESHLAKAHVSTFASREMPQCSISWDEQDRDAQIADNWIHLTIDYLLLGLIVSVVVFIVYKRQLGVKIVNVQLVLLILAQCLYCMRSTARVYSADQTFFGRSLPQWTEVSKKLANIFATIQHWVYASAYLNAALALRLFLSINTSENLQRRREMERLTSIYNGILYALLLAVLLLDLFMDGHVASTVVNLALSLLMAAVLGLSMVRLTPLLRSVRRTGLQARTALLKTQVAILLVITLVDCGYIIAKIYFFRQCNDDLMQESLAAVATQSFQMIERFMLSILTVIMCTFLLAHSKQNYTEAELVAIENEIRFNLCIEDDIAYCSECVKREKEIDGDSETVTETDGQGESMQDSDLVVLTPTQLKQEAKKRRQLLLQLLSISKGQFERLQRNHSQSIMTVDFSAFHSLVSSRNTLLANSEAAPSKVIRSCIHKRWGSDPRFQEVPQEHFLYQEVRLASHSLKN